jgi:hypothetical protein
MRRAERRKLVGRDGDCFFAPESRRESGKRPLQIRNRDYPHVQIITVLALLAGKPPPTNVTLIDAPGVKEKVTKAKLWI